MPNTFNTNEQTVYNAAIGEGATDTVARIVISQLKHESADFTSNVFKKNNNPMGMKMPSKRKSPFIAGAGTKPPGNEGATPYARYNSLEDAVKDLFDFFKFNGYNFSKVYAATTPGQAIEAYSEELRRKGYMGSTQTAKTIYIAGLSKWYNRLAGFVSGGSIGFFLILIAFAALFYYLTLKQ